MLQPEELPGYKGPTLPATDSMEYLVQKPEPFVLQELAANIPPTPFKILELVFAKLDNYLPKDSLTGAPLSPEEQQQKKERLRVVEIGGPDNEGELEAFLGLAPGTELSKTRLNEYLSYYDKSLDLTPDDPNRLEKFFLFNKTIAKKTKKKWHIIFIFSDDSLENIVIPANIHYIRYHLKNTAKLRKKYSLFLYTLLVSQRDYRSEVKIALSDLRRIFHCNEKYPEWGDFERYALLPAMKEVVEQTDCKFTYDTYKEGQEQKVVAVIFKIEPREQDYKTIRANKMLKQHGSTNAKGALAISEQDEILLFNIKSYIINDLINQLNDSTIIAIFSRMTKIGNYESVVEESGTSLSQTEYYCRILEEILNKAEERQDKINHLPAYVLTSVTNYFKEGKEDV